MFGAFVNSGSVVFVGCWLVAVPVVVVVVVIVCLFVCLFVCFVFLSFLF